MKRILLTGNKGFIGKYISRDLKNEGYIVEGLDIVDGLDLNDNDLLESMIKSVDVVFHLAAQADLYKMTSNYESLDDGIDLNVLTTKRIALLCSQYKKKLIFASTVCVYGNIDRIAHEDTALPNPSEAYACSKYAAEWIIMGISKSFGLEYTILRFATVYGINMRAALGAQTFINQAIAGNDITVHGDGKQERTLTHVEDLSRACVLVVKNEKSTFNQIFNVSDTDHISAIKMAEDIKRISKSSSNIVFIAQRPNQTFKENISNEKIRNALNWEPQKNWLQGITEVIVYEKERQGTL